MNTWDDICVLYSSPTTHAHKMHICKYQTFLLSMKWHIRTFLIFIMFANTWKDAKLPNEQEVDFSKESACYWISKCSVLISNKEVLFVLSWSGYKKWTIMRAIIYLLVLRKWLLVLAKGSNQKQKNWSFNEAISNKANWYLCTVELRYISKWTNIQKMSVRYS